MKCGKATTKSGKQWLNKPLFSSNYQYIKPHRPPARQKAYKRLWHLLLNHKIKALFSGIILIYTLLASQASISSYLTGPSKPDVLENTNAVTGGDSFCEMAFIMDGQSEILEARVLNKGKYPLYDVSVRIADVDQIKNGIWEQSLKNYHIGNLTPAYLTPTPIRLSHHGKDLNYNIFYVARNGAWVQVLRMRWVGDGWGTATKILKGLGGEELYQDVSSNFPRGPNGEIDWRE